MQPMDDFMTREPTVLEAMWRYRWIVVSSVALFLSLAIVVSVLRPPQYVATASLLLEDPGSSSPFGSEIRVPVERFLAEQVGILSSEAVAARAVEIIADEDPSLSMTTEELLGGVRFSSDPGTNTISVSFQAGRTDLAILGANAMAQGYEAVRTLSLEQAALNEASRMSAALRLVAGGLAEIDDQVTQLRLEGSDVLDAQLAQALSELIELRDRRQQSIDEEEELTGGDPTVGGLAVERLTLEREAIRTDIDDLFRELQTSQLLQTLQAQQPALAALLQSQADLLGLQSQLTSRRSEAMIEAELASSGVVLFTRSSRAFAQGLGFLPTLVIMSVLGGAVGGGVAYFMAFRKRTFTHRLEPESILGAHLLAEVPDFAEEGVKSEIPVATDASSIAAEAFRFVATAIEFRAPRRESGDADESVHAAVTEQAARVLAVVSATRDDGKTVITANTAIAAARSGSTVLVIDGDFSSQAVSRLLLGNVSMLPGITDCVIDRVPVASAFETVQVMAGTTLSVMGRGQVELPAASLFRMEGLGAFMQDVRTRFDLVLIDAPPLLQVAYAGPLLQLVDGAVVVVRHGSDIIDLEEVADRLDFTGTVPVGYVYNRAPLRRALAGPEGSIGEVAAAALARSGTPQGGKRHKRS